MAGAAEANMKPGWVGQRRLQGWVASAAGPQDLVSRGGRGSATGP